MIISDVADILKRYMRHPHLLEQFVVLLDEILNNSRQIMMIFFHGESCGLTDRPFRSVSRGISGSLSARNPSIEIA